MFLIFLICRGMDIIKIWYAYFLLHISPEVPCRLQAVVLQRLAIPWVHSHIGLGIYILYSDYWNFCTGGVFRYYQNLFHINPLYLQKARQFISSPANMVFKLLDGHLQYAYHMQDMPGRTWRTCFAKSGASSGGRAELATLGRILGCECQPIIIYRWCNPTPCARIHLEKMESSLWMSKRRPG